MSDMVPAIFGGLAFAALVGGIVHHALTARSQRRDITANPLRLLSSHEIVRRHCNEGANSHFLSEMIRRLMMSAQHISEWLLWLTIVICALTALMAWTTWKASTAPPPAPPALLDSV